DGFVLVESGSRKYTGFVFETGDFDVCNKIADILSQKQHEDIESDYERGKENNSPSVISLNVSDMYLYVPLLISTNRNTNESNLHSPQHVVYNSIGMNHAVTPIRRNTRGDKSWQMTLMNFTPSIIAIQIQQMQQLQQRQRLQPHLFAILIHQFYRHLHHEIIMTQ
ncbi:unnamed protein product, partial [Rotaria magnacalcarata]